MFMPIKSFDSTADSSKVGGSEGILLTLHADGQLITVTHDGFSIGSSKNCDLTLNDPAIPAVHSLIHIQSGAIWIEAASDDIQILVNNRPYRRMALRHDDSLKLGDTDYSVHFGTDSADSIEQSSAPVTEDLSLLTAEELCDRILAEQAMVTEFDDGQRVGWEALLKAIEASNDEQEQSPIELDPVTSESQKAAFDALLEQINHLNDVISDRTLELSDQEKQVLESASILEESQARVHHRLDEILDQLKQSDEPKELRASA